MSYRISRRGLLRVGAAFGAMIMVPGARACEFFAPNLRVEHPYTIATGDQDFAMVGMHFDEVTRADRLIGVRTPVAAAAEMGGDDRGGPVALDIPAGEETVLSPHGRHIRLTGLAHPLEVGRSYPMTLVFEFGGEVPALLNVDYAALR